MFSMSPFILLFFWVKRSLSHVQGRFLVVSLMRQSVNITRLWVGVSMLEKSLKSVKYEAKSMSPISLSVSLPLVLLPNIFPLLFSSFLTPPQLWRVTLLKTRFELDTKAPRGDYVLLESQLRHALRQFYVRNTSAVCSALYKGRGVRLIKSAHTSIFQVNVRTSSKVLCLLSDLHKRKSQSR